MSTLVVFLNSLFRGYVASKKFELEHYTVRQFRIFSNGFGALNLGI